MRPSFLPLLLLAFLLLGCVPTASTPEPIVTEFVPPTRIVLPTASSTQEGELGPGRCELEGPLPLGAVISESGAAGVYGEAIRKGMELAVEEINATGFIGPLADIELIVEDDQSDKDVASRAFRRLIQEENVLGILGPTLSTSAFVADPVAQAAGVPTMGTSNTAVGITEIGNYIFRNSLPEADVIPTTISTARQGLGIESVVILYDQDDRFTQSGFDIMLATSERQGLEVLAVEPFSKETTDFTEILERVRPLQPDALLISALASEGVPLLIQAREMGIDVPVVGGNGFNSPALLEQAGEAAEGLIVGAAWFVQNPIPENLEFVTAYQAAYESEPDQFAAQAYAGVWLYAHALRNACTTERRTLRDALGALRLIPTPLGKFSFTGERNPLHPPVVLTVEGGEFVLFRSTQ